MQQNQESYNMSSTKHQYKCLKNSQWWQ